MFQEQLFLITQNLSLTSSTPNFIFSHTVVLQPIFCMKHIMRTADSISIQCKLFAIRVHVIKFCFYKILLLFEDHHVRNHTRQSTSRNNNLASVTLACDTHAPVTHLFDGNILYDLWFSFRSSYHNNRVYSRINN